MKGDEFMDLLNEHLTKYDEKLKYYNIDDSTTGFDAIQKLGIIENLPNIGFLRDLSLLGRDVYMINYAKEPVKIQLTGFKLHNGKLLYQYQEHFYTEKIYETLEEAYENLAKTNKGGS